MSISNHINELIKFYHFTRTKRLEMQSFARHLKTLFQVIDVQCVFDVGANTGGYRDFLRNKVGYKGLIISFEPVKKNVEMLRMKSKKDDAWVIYDFALGSEISQSIINVMNLDKMSSFLQPDHETVSHYKCLNKVDYEEEVSVKTLDSIFDELVEKHSVSKIFLKMDTQGYDLEVVKGAKTNLYKILALQTEVSIRQIYKEMPNFSESSTFLSDMGFDITGIYPVNRDYLQRVIEFDCILINKNFEEHSIAEDTSDWIWRKVKMK